MMTSLLALIALTSSSSIAGSYNAHGFTLVPSDGDLHDPIGMWRPELQVKRSFGIDLLVEFAKAPLVSYHYDVDGELVEEPLVDNLLGFNLGAAYALHERVALTLAMPLWANAEDIEGSAHAGLGDLRFGVPVGILLPTLEEGETDPSHAAGFALSAIPFASLPSGAKDLYLGTGGFGVGGVVAAGYGDWRWQVFANAGAEYAPLVTDLANLRGGAFLKANLGASVRIVDPFALRLEGTLNAPLKKNEVPFTESPSELILTGRYRSDFGLNFTAGAAKALTPGAGAARWRVFAGAGWTFGKDSEGTPVVAEDPCRLTVIVQDPKGQPVKDAQVSFGNRVETSAEDGRAAFDRCRPGPDNKVSAQAPLYKPVESEGFELAAGPNERILVLEPLDSKLKVIVLDDKGAPVDARVRFLNGPADQPFMMMGPDGEETIDLKPGAWTLLASEKRFVPQEKSVELDPGEFETVTFQFTSDVVYNVCTEAVTLRNVNFDFDIDTPREDSLPTLRSIASSLKDCPDVVVEVGGHTDSKGSDAYNIDLSQRRMNSVKQILMSYGVAEARMIARGYGESKPIATNKTDAGRAQNRRVEFVPLEGKAVVLPPPVVPPTPETPPSDAGR